MALITNLSPPAGTPIAPDGMITFDVIDPVIEELRVFVWVVFAATGQVELVYDGDNFQPNYSGSAIASTPGGRTFAVRRVTGWPSQPELRVADYPSPPTAVEPVIGLPMFDNRAAPAQVSSTDVFDFTIDTAVFTIPTVSYLRVHLEYTGGGLLADIRAYTDVGKTNKIYEALGRTIDDPAPGHEDGTPWAGFNSTAGLTAGLLYIEVDLAVTLGGAETCSVYLVAGQGPL